MYIITNLINKNFFLPTTKIKFLIIQKWTRVIWRSYKEKSDVIFTLQQQKKNWQINIKEIKGLNDIIESINRIRKERIPQEKATRIKYDAKSG